MSVVAAATSRRRRRPATRAHKIAISVYLVLFAVVAVVSLIPIRTGFLRLMLVSGIFSLWAGALFLFWDRIVVRVICFSLALAAGTLVFLPMRTIDQDALRSEYLRSLQGYNGTPYLWGGETHLGIDCSGLVRVGLIDAEFKEAIRTRNFILLRKSASLWWNDCSAQALGEEFQGRTRHILDTRSLNTADYSQIQPGDMAIIFNGTHILVYRGEKTWIAADPDVMKVVTTHVPDQQKSFITPARIMRWRIMEPTPASVEPR